MKKKQVYIVYASGLVQGLALVAFPAAGEILTSPMEFNLSSTAYGSLFIPQAVLSIGASLCSAKLSRWKGSGNLLLFGLIGNFLAMALLALSSLAMKGSFAYGMLLTATTFLGLAFGLAVPSLNALVVLLFPKKREKALLILNALLGLGMAVSPLLISFFVGFAIWWGLPLLVALAALGALFAAAPLDFPTEKKERHRESSRIPLFFWLFALFALLYGIVETVNGNWGAIYMKKSLHASSLIALFSLTFFWSMVTVGRIFFTAVAERFTFRLLPFVIAGALLFVSQLSPGSSSGMEVAAFGLAGIGCSALLPLTISLAGRALPMMASSAVAGGVISFYLLGYGVAAFGVGPLLDWGGIDLPAIFKWSSGIALILAILAFPCCSASSR